MACALQRGEERGGAVRQGVRVISGARMACALQKVAAATARGHAVRPDNDAALSTTVGVALATGDEARLDHDRLGLD